jgi:hypothetical protein
MVAPDETHNFDQTFGARLLLRSVQREVAELRACLALKRLIALSNKLGFNPTQLRIPAGQPGGGRWTDGDGDDVVLIDRVPACCVRAPVRARAWRTPAIYPLWRRRAAEGLVILEAT